MASSYICALLFVHLWSQRISCILIMRNMHTDNAFCILNSAKFVRLVSRVSFCRFMQTESTGACPTHTYFFSSNLCIIMTRAASRWKHKKEKLLYTNLQRNYGFVMKFVVLCAERNYLMIKSSSWSVICPKYSLKKATFQHHLQPRRQILHLRVGFLALSFVILVYTLAYARFFKCAPQMFLLHCVT